MSIQEHYRSIATKINSNDYEGARQELDVLKPLALGTAKYHDLLGILLAKTGEYQPAMQELQKSLTIDPAQHLVHYALANVFKILNKPEQAVKHFDRSIELSPEFFDAINQRGVIHTDLGRYKEAASDLKKALKINPKSASALVNMGNVFFHKRKMGEALNYYLSAQNEDQNYAMAFYNAANIYQYFGDYANSLKNMDVAFRLKVSTPFFLGMYCYTKLHHCDWSNLQELTETLVHDLESGKKAARPFQVMALLDRPDLERLAAKAYVNTKFPRRNQFPKLVPQPIKNRKIRIGYFSSDFCDHPVSYLMAKVFQVHDRSRFEIFAFSFNHGKNDGFTKLVKESVDHFFDVNHLSDPELVLHAREHQLDIAVDLNGITRNCRTGVFAERVAPIQINYIGYLGTMGVDYYDYIISDPVLIPTEERKNYSENILCLPVYQANDDALPDPSIVVTRQQFSLPEKAFVFCSFNNNYKLHPELFTVWMDILGAVPDSVLWLYVTNESAKSNILKFVDEKGLATSRIIFAEKVPLPMHIVRHKLADLFLDTYPYNGGATSTAALRAGLPVLTLCGRSFSSRMGASLLAAVGLNDLAAHSLQEYKQTAIDLGLSPQRARALKVRLSNHLRTTKLYDTEYFVANLERGFEMALTKRQLL